MSGCCNEGKKVKHEAVCPAHGGACREVAYRTVLHHLKRPWRAGLTSQRYYFCGAADCPVAYFGEDGLVFKEAVLREPVGQKVKSPEAMLCYCFDIRYGEASGDPTLKDFVVEQTAAGMCGCDIRNPSGRCCLKDFPK